MAQRQYGIVIGYNYVRGVLCHDAEKWVVEQSRRRANPFQVSDFIKFVAIPKAVDPAIIRDLYLKNGFTASQIAEQVGLSKPAVLARLHQMGVRKVHSKGQAVDNYRFTQRVPFGKRLVAGRLLDDRKDLKTARYIVELRQRQGLPWKEVVTKVNLSGYRTKKGLLWKVGTVRMVFERWRGKI